MLRVVLGLGVVAIALGVFSLIDCAQSDSAHVRRLSKWQWAAVILILPVIGAVAWLAAGRPRSAKTVGRTSRPRPVAPDDNLEFLTKLEREQRRVDEAMFSRWEDDLRQREKKLKGPKGPKGSGTPGKSGRPADSGRRGDDDGEDPTPAV